jgi:hypothetical protein
MCVAPQRKLGFDRRRKCTASIPKPEDGVNARHNPYEHHERHGEPDAGNDR